MTDQIPVNIWFPRLSPSGDHLVGGNHPIFEDGVLIATDGTHAVYETEDSIVYELHDSEGLMRWWRGSGISRVLSAVGIGGNHIAAAPRMVAIDRFDPVRVILSDGRVFLGEFDPQLSDDGRWLATRRHDNGLILVRDLSNPTTSAREIAVAQRIAMRNTSLCWELDGRIFGIGDVSNPALGYNELTVRGEACYKPIPVWNGARLYVLCHTQHNHLLVVWGTSMGWVVHEGATDGEQDARYWPSHSAQGHPVVRCVTSLAGAPIDVPIDVSTRLVDLSIKPDSPFVGDPNGVIPDVLPRLRRGTQGDDGRMLWQHKGDGSFDGAHLDYDDKWIGLYDDGPEADQRTANKGWMSVPHLWMARRVTSGWWALYNTEFLWEDGSSTNENVFVANYVGHGVYQGVPADQCHVFHSLKPDPLNSARLEGFLEFDFYNEAGGNQRWEEWHQDANGHWYLNRVTQPYPKVPGPMTPPWRPQAMLADPIVTPPKITIRDGYGPTSGLGWQARATIQGVVTRISWRWRKQGTQRWTRKDVVPAIDPTRPPDGRALDILHLSETFPEPGTYEIGVDCWGPKGRDGTTHRRVIEVS